MWGEGNETVHKDTAPFVSNYTSSYRPYNSNYSSPSSSHAHNQFLKKSRILTDMINTQV